MEAGNAMTSLYTPYSGRLADIMDEVYSLSADTKNGIFGTARYVTPAELLLWIGRGLEDIANGGYFKASTTIDVTASQTEYNLLTLIPRLVKADVVRKTANDDWMGLAGDQAAYAMGKQYASDWETGKYGYLRGTKFYMIDPPTATTTDALEVYHSYYPPYVITLSQVAVVNATGGKVTLSATAHELEVGDYVMIYGSTNYSGRKLITAVTTDTFTFAATYVAETIGAAVTCHCEPRIPISKDITLTYFCQMRRAMKDRKSAAGIKDYNQYFAQYEAEKSKLLSSGTPPVIRIRTPR
jgi:hypothetical protein